MPPQQTYPAPARPYHLGNDFHRDVVASVDNNEVSYYMYGQRSYGFKKNESKNKQIFNEEAIQFIERFNKRMK